MCVKILGQVFLTQFVSSTLNILFFHEFSRKEPYNFLFLYIWVDNVFCFTPLPRTEGIKCCFFQYLVCYCEVMKIKLQSKSSLAKLVSSICAFSQPTTTRISRPSVRMTFYERKTTSN